MKRFFAVLLMLALVLSAGSIQALAHESSAEAHERAMLRLLDTAWEGLESVEKEMLTSSADPRDVTLAVYKAALASPYVDEGSLTGLTRKAFSFRVSGMLCRYDYAARNARHISSVSAEMLESAEEALRVSGQKNGPSDLDVLIVGPFYGIDANFTNQYRNEARSITDVTGGSFTVLSSSNATGPAIAAAFPDAGIVVFDSHGSGGYLCLTTTEGITSEDYLNDWASSAGDSAYIDGRYIQHHVPRRLPNSMVWMAMCEGMILSNHGQTGAALLEAGAGCVYGYSQEVTFGGDYRYEAHFWNNMKYNDTTVAEAFDAMTEELGYWDPLMSSAYGSAWPVVMSPVDPYPSDPDSHQTVHCDWRLFGAELDPVALESFTLSPDPLAVYQGTSSVIRFGATPDNANQYELNWQSEDEGVATVAGNAHTARVTGVTVGTTRIRCEVNAAGLGSCTAYCEVNVLPYPDIDEALNVEGGSLDFTSTQHPWETVILDDRIAARSGNAGVNSSTSTLQLTLSMEAGETLTFDWMVSSERFDKLGFFVNNSLYGDYIAGAVDWSTVVYTAPSTGSYTFEWRYVKDVNINSLDDCGYVDNVLYSGDEGPSVLLGDVDGSGTVNANDALLLMRYVLGLVEETDLDLSVGDYDGDGSVNANDALTIMRFALGLL